MLNEFVPQWQHLFGCWNVECICTTVATLIRLLECWMYLYHSGDTYSVGWMFNVFVPRWWHLFGCWNVCSTVATLVLPVECCICLYQGGDTWNMCWSVILIFLIYSRKSNHSLLIYHLLRNAISYLLSLISCLYICKVKKKMRWARSTFCCLGLLCLLVCIIVCQFQWVIFILGV